MFLLCEVVLLSLIVFCAWHILKQCSAKYYILGLAFLIPLKSNMIGMIFQFSGLTS